ncbi:MAG TPA: recombinase family protein [Phycisphaerae bacterium]|nr:recombinase family protein [Phycisphaerae bacterium]
MIGAYIRVSSPKRLARQDTASQRARIGQYAKAHGLTSPRWYEDHASGRTAKRPALAELLADCRKGAVSQILVSDLSRLSRSVKDAVELVRELVAHNVKLVCVNQGFSFEPSALNNAMLQIMAVLAELESAIKSERIKAGLELARERGVRLGAKPDHRKRQQARILRDKGLTYRAIASQMKISHQGVWYLLQRTASPQTKGEQAKKAV